jgi:hypothetical protein
MEDFKAVDNFGTRIKRKPAQTLLSLCAEIYNYYGQKLIDSRVSGESQNN